jgi:hypothetical protein
MITVHVTMEEMHGEKTQRCRSRCPDSCGSQHTAKAFRRRWSDSDLSGSNSVFSGIICYDLGITR